MDDQRPRIVATYNKFDGQDLASLGDFYAKDVLFQDPITTIKGLSGLKTYYAHVYANVRSVRFDFSEIGRDGNTYYAPWIMKLVAKGLNNGKEFDVHGLSQLQFNAAGLVQYHRDYLDLGEMVYERLPIQGFVIRQIKKALK